MKGRKPETTAVKKLRGTYTPSRAKGLTGGELITKLPTPPDFLQDGARVIFTRVCNILIQGRRLYGSDIHLLAMFSQELHTYEIASDNLKAPGDHITTSPAGGDKPSPWIQIRNQALKNVKDLGALFGLDPLSRERMKPVEEEKRNLLQELMDRY